MRETWPILEDIDLRYTVAVDGISLFFLLLTTFIAMIYSVALYNFFLPQVKAFVVATLFLEGMVVGVILAQNIMMFFLFMQGAMISGFFLLGLSAKEKARDSAFRFAITMVFSSFLLLVAAFLVNSYTDIESLSLVARKNIPLSISIVIWLMFCVAFTPYIPVLPFHNWYVYVLRNVPASQIVFVISMLTIVGFYGFLRLSILFFPLVVKKYAFFVYIPVILSIFYALAKALYARTVKQNIGYIIMAVTNVAIIALLTMQYQNIVGGIMLFFNSVLSSVGLLIFLGFLQLRAGEVPWLVERNNNTFALAPKLYIAYLLLTLSLCVIPLTGSFSAMIVLLVAFFKSYPLFGFLAIVVYVFVAVRLIYIQKIVFYDTFKENSLKAMPEIRWQEGVVVWSILAVSAWMGIEPNVFIRPVEKSVWALLSKSF